MTRSVNRHLALAAILVPAVASAQVDYAKAERMLTWNTAPLVVNDVISVTWLADSTRFWYHVTRPNGSEFVLVDPVANAQRPLFDHLRLAAALTKMDAGKKSYEATKLPFRTFTLLNGERTLRFKSGERWIECDLTRYDCGPTTYKPRSAAELISPDSQWVAYIKDYNVWVKRAAGGDSTQLTTDGIRFFAYGTGERSPGRIRTGEPMAPSIVWSPDGKRLIVMRTDERGVGMFPLYSSTTIRPSSYLMPYSLPGDSVFEKGTRYLIDVAAKTSRAITEPAVFSIGFGGGTGGGGGGEWNPDSRSFRYGDMTRADKVASLYRVDAQTGARKRLAFDSSATYIDQVEFHVFPGGRGTMAMSERDGWKHLYLFDTTGVVQRQLTSGPWLVADVVRVDDATGTIYFTAQGREPGRDPYYVKGYRVKIDGSPVELLTPEDAEHEVRVAPGGHFIVDTYSRVDLPPVTVLRTPDGRLLKSLEKADASALMATGYRPPEPFKVKARDGVTDLYGAIWRPNNFDSTKVYPVIDNIYPGPQLTTGPKGFVPNNNPDALSSGYSQYSQAKALAELGFIVVNLDAMGTTHRSKAFRETWYANMGDNGLPDHIAGLKQLAATRPYMDLTRVGIYGISGGGFASTDAILRYPEFFKVAVSTSGNHDNRSYNMHWGEKYTGVLARDTLRKTDTFDSQANLNMAANLRGKLFLIHGDMDDNVSPANTLRLVDALIKAGKTFDMLIVPDAGHMMYYLPYVHRVQWDYFVRHLRHEEPPSDYVVGGPPPPP
ncbi:MAG: DPP IV N-terminal domain-containing protein [bacterium]